MSALQRLDAHWLHARVTETLQQVKSRAKVIKHLSKNGANAARIAALARRSRQRRRCLEAVAAAVLWSARERKARELALCTTRACADDDGGGGRTLGGGGGTGMSTASMTWIRPLVHSTSACARRRRGAGASAPLRNGNGWAEWARLGNRAADDSGRQALLARLLAADADDACAGEPR